MLDKHLELRERTKQFALRVVRLSQSVPRTDTARVLAKQVLRSGTSVAANYRAAGRARSKAEFIAKIGDVVEEADETLFWLELLVESGIVPKDQLADLISEATELVAIFVASQKTARGS